MNQIYKPKHSLKISPNIKKIILAIMFLLSAFTGFVSQNLLSAGMVVCIIILFAFDELYLAFPFLLFYYSFYGTLLGVSVFRIFSILLLVSYVFRGLYLKPIEKTNIMPLMVCLIYLLAVLSKQNVSTALWAFVDIICCVIIITYDLREDTEKIKQFFTVFALVAFVAYFTGIFAGNVIEQTEKDGIENVEYIRRLSTFEDPNYMGCFYTIAVFSTFVLKLFKPTIRALLIVAFYLMMLTSLSITGIVVNIALWAIYLVTFKKLRISIIILIFAVLIVAILLYNYGLEHRNDSVFGGLAYRIQTKLEDFKDHEMGAVTSGRTDYTKYHLEIFKELPLTNKLFGGMLVNLYHIDPVLEAAAHNEYVDLLLNVGIIGTIIMVGYASITWIRHFIKYKKSKEEKYMLWFMCKSTWIAYAFTLTVFLDYRFMFLFFI